MAKLKARFGAPMFCFGPHASTTPAESMARAPAVDGMFVGEPEDGALQLARSSRSIGSATIPSLDLACAAARRSIVPHRAQGQFTGFLDDAVSGVGPARRSIDYALPLVNKPLRASSRRAAAARTACDFCVAPIHQGHKFRERSAKALVDEIERSYRELGVEFFYLWGDTVTLNVKTFTRVLRRADRAQAADPVVRQRPRRQPRPIPRSSTGCGEAGCWMLALGIETESEEIRKDMVKRLERAEDPGGVQQHARRRDPVVRVLHLRLPGRDAGRRWTARSSYAIELDPDFANFYPAVPYPGTALYDKCVTRRAARRAKDWSRMEYSCYLLRGNGLDEHDRDGRDQPRQATLLPAPGLHRRARLGDVVKLALTEAGASSGRSPRARSSARRSPTRRGHAARRTGDRLKLVRSA